MTELERYWHALATDETRGATLLAWLRSKDPNCQKAAQRIIKWLMSQC